MRRPSGKELNKKLNEALSAVLSGSCQFPLTKHLVSDLEDLEVEDESELMRLVAESLREIMAAGAERCYAGTRPPMRSYESEIKDLELWPFAWSSTVFGRCMYLKFALKRGIFLYVDCHEDRP